MWMCWDSPTDPETLAIARKMADDIAGAETERAITPTPIGGLWRFAFEESYEIDEVVELQDERRRLSRALLALTPREERIIRLYFGMGCDEHTYEEIAEQFNVTPVRIQQIEAKALRKLQRTTKRRPFRGHVAALPQWGPRHYQPSPAYLTEVNGKIVPITIKKWIVGDKRHEHVLGMPGPYFVFDHGGIEMVGAKQELITRRVV